MEVESITNNEINNIANTENDEIIVSQGAEAVSKIKINILYRESTSLIFMVKNV